MPDEQRWLSHAFASLLAPRCPMSRTTVASSESSCTVKESPVCHCRRSPTQCRSRQLTLAEPLSHCSRRDFCELRYVTAPPGPLSFSHWWYKGFQASARPLRKCKVGNQVAKMGMFRRLFAPDVAIDLGTANTLVFVKGWGVVLSEPSVVAVDTKTDEVVAVGSAAKSMIGRTPAHIVATQPLKNGVIADFEVTEKMLAYFIRGARPKRSVLRYLLRARVAVCVPSGVTGVELRAVKEATESAGARKAYTIEEPLAAAIGVDLPVSEPEGSMVVDVGGGTTEVAVISLGGIVTKTSVRVAGNDM